MTKRAHAQRSPYDYRTLVLNADGRPLATFPLSLISAEAAIQAVVKDSVSVVENWDRAFHSPSTTITIPKVVMLREYQPIYAEAKFCRRSVLLRDRLCCQYCGNRFESADLTFDHVIPRSKGGQTTWDNILMACMRCNALKKNQDANLSGRRGHAAADGRLRPLKLPRRPTNTELLKAGLEFLSNDVKENFGEFLYWHIELEA